MEVTIVDIAKAARERIRKPEHWTKGCYARDRGGLDVEHEAAGAPVCWCISGAVSWAFWDVVDTKHPDNTPSRTVFVRELRTLRNRIWKMSDVISQAAGFGGLAAFNDYPRTTHADALAHMDTLVSMLEKEAA